jgi:hypothetical protein
MKNQTLLTLFILLFAGLIFAQETPCGFKVDEKAARMLDGKDSEFKKRLAMFDLSSYRSLIQESTKIPVVIHIIRRSDGSGGTTEAKVRTSLGRANQDYQSMNMEFTICDIKYINNDTYFNASLSSGSTESTVANANNVEDVINVYCYPNSFTSWAYFPFMSEDWIVMRNSHIENRSTFSHELGHYFGLYHTHETYFCVEAINGSNCSNCGDQICDTPADPNLSGKVNSSCAYTGDSRYSPMVNNLMSYAPKVCRTTFTTQQQERITFTFLNERNYLRNACEGFISLTNKRVGDFAGWAATSSVKIIPGDYNGDGKSDFALVRQASGWATIPIAFANGDGTFTITNKRVGDFAGWAATSNVKIVPGDYNGDGKDDIALVRQVGGWATIPIAFSNGDGNFTITNKRVGDFAGWAATSNVKIVPGDYNGDGKDDIALVRQVGGWATVPIAFSTSGGNFTITNKRVGDFAGWAATSGVKIVPGDYNGDGKDDIALVRQASGWGSIPIAFATSGGNFNITNGGVGSFAGWAATSGVKIVPGDYNGDGKDDIALVRQASGWGSIPIAFATSGGNFNITNGGVGSFAAWAATSDVKIVPGDYNGDGKDDIALVRQVGGWATVPVAHSTSGGNFNITNDRVGNFARWAATSNVKIIAGDYNNDNKTNLALIRQQSGWATIPVLFAW